jgi:hypothetical protein
MKLTNISSDLLALVHQTLDHRGEVYAPGSVELQAPIYRRMEYWNHSPGLDGWSTLDASIGA